MTGRFLPASPAEMRAAGWAQPDFVYVTGDAYVDHPSFGHAIISRVLEAAGYKVAMLPQPDWHSAEPFRAFGRPRLGFLVSAGVIDSMVNNYTVAKRRRERDVYAPGGRTGFRPDRATVVYCNRIREAFGSVPIAIGGVEASLRRFAHYDYWDDRVRNSILVDSGADVLMFGMGERSVLEVARWMETGRPFSEMRTPGTCVMAGEVPEGFILLPSAEEVRDDRQAYARCYKEQYDQQDPVRGRPMAQKHQDRYLLQNRPDLPLTEEEMDRVYDLPYARAWHPMYDAEGGIPALAEVQFSITSVRGCYGSCNFCALNFHQGRIVTSRSRASILREARILTGLKGFKGYIHDVGGPTANFRKPPCRKQLKSGACRDRECLFPKPCPNLRADHTEYLEILRSLRALPGVKKVFIRSGIRYDYVLADRSGAFLRELAEHHVSGQLKVAPEHASNRVLGYMGKPDIECFDAFRRRFEQENERLGKKQYMIPYFMSSHPGCTMEDAVALALYMKRAGLHPDQVQDFYPTPGTLSTAMYYTGLDPRTMKTVYVPRDREEKAMQRALMQYNKPQNRALVQKALLKCGRGDLIGMGRDCLIPPRDLERKKRGPGDERPSAGGTKRRPGDERPSAGGTKRRPGDERPSARGTKHRPGDERLSAGGTKRGPKDKRPSAGGTKRRGRG
ncbi:MAG: YgiQ family radical SAM protein [Clostridia bacterium]|nr:YgiQ family radical SAM protein [Clostridia bacterium]